MRRLAHWMRKWADRVDPDGAPRYTGLSFTFEQGQGLVVNDEQRGCSLWYLGLDSYDRAHTESRTEER